MIKKHLRGNKIIFFLPLLCSFFSTCRSGNDSFTQNDILKNLASSGKETYHFFIDLEHPYFYTAGSRLTLYADENRWAIVFEKSGYANRGLRGEIEFAYFGNCLINLWDKEWNTTSNMQTVTLITNDEIDRIVSDSLYFILPDIKQAKVRDSFLTVEQDKSVYRKMNIVNPVYQEEKLIDLPSLIRYLDEKNPSLFRATDTERRMCLPADLPKIMEIDQWHHKSYYPHGSSTTRGVNPASYETYRMIADVLVTRDSSKWKPALKPNNDWRNWPEAGTF